jgi:hypothetical protein
MLVKRKALLFILGLVVVVSAIYAHTDDTSVGREQLVHPDVGHEGTGLHTKVRNAWTAISNDMPGRWDSYASVSDNTLTTVTHNFGVALTELEVKIYTGTHPDLTRVEDTSTWTIAANGTNPKTQVDITTPTSGGPWTFSVQVLQAATSTNELKDMDLSGIITGQVPVYNSVSGNFEPGSSGDSSFKMVSFTDIAITINAGTERINSKLYCTYDGTGTTEADITTNHPYTPSGLGANETWHLYIDTEGAVETTLTDSGRVCWMVYNDDYFKSVSHPDSGLIDVSRYAYIGSFTTDGDSDIDAIYPEIPRDRASWANINYDLQPIGSISAYGGSSAPDGWLVCDGSSVLKTSYSELYGIIGTSYGSVDATHFNLPDLRGKFVRGVDSGAGNDPDAASRVACNTGGNTGDSVGSCQSDANKSHGHDFDLLDWDFDGHSGTTGILGFGSSSAVTSYGRNFITGVNIFSSSDGNKPVYGGVNNWNPHISIADDGGNDSRPENVSVVYIIKYKSEQSAIATPTKNWNSGDLTAWPAQGSCDSGWSQFTPGIDFYYSTPMSLFSSDTVGQQYTEIIKRYDGYVCVDPSGFDNCSGACSPGSSLDSGDTIKLVVGPAADVMALPVFKYQSYSISSASVTLPNFEHIENVVELSGCSSTSNNLILPTAASNYGKTVTIKYTGGTVNSVTGERCGIQGNGAELIDSSNTYTEIVAQYEGVTLFSNGTKWLITKKNLLPLKFTGLLDSNNYSIPTGTLVALGYPDSATDSHNINTGADETFTIRIPRTTHCTVNMTIEFQGTETFSAGNYVEFQVDDIAGWELRGARVWPEGSLPYYTYSGTVGFVCLLLFQLGHPKRFQSLICCLRIAYLKRFQNLICCLRTVSQGLFVYLLRHQTAPLIHLETLSL